MNSMEELFSVEQRFHFVFLRVLELCETPRSTNEIADIAASYSELSDSLYSISAILSWLADVGALSHTMPDKDNPEMWETSPEAIEWVYENNPAIAFAKLVEQEPEYSDLFIDITKYCATAKSLQDIESHYHNYPVIISKGVQPSYIVFLLEQVGAIAWADGWKTTSVGSNIS